MLLSIRTLNILVVTRNRLAALIDALASVKRLASLADGLIRVEVTIQDNSDNAVPDSILRYFSKAFPLQYYKTISLLAMSVNWNEGLMHVARLKPDYIAVLADRRLVSANLLDAIKYLDTNHEPFICFDHQDAWINAQRILKREHTYKLQTFSRDALLAAIGAAQIDWHYPMLFNCVIRSDFMLELVRRYGSFAEGASPDMNFLARVADIGINPFCTYDAPCILTNARHAASSNGTSALKSGTIHHTEHTRLSGTEAYPPYMENFVTANITGSLARYWSSPQMRNLIDVSGFLRSSLLELSYPKSEAAFSVMKESLIQFTNDFCLDADARLLIESVQHTPSCNQGYPIDSSAYLSNAPALNLLSEVEGTH
jgi:hypothetical protein